MVIVCVSHKCNKTGQFHRNSSDVSSFRKPFSTDQYLSFLNRVKRGGRSKRGPIFFLHYSFAKMHMACKSACSALPLWSPKIEKRRERERVEEISKMQKRISGYSARKDTNGGESRLFLEQQRKSLGIEGGDVSICGWPVVRSDSVKGTVCNKTVIRIFCFHDATMDHSWDQFRSRSSGMIILSLHLFFFIRMKFYVNFLVSLYFKD